MLYFNFKNPANIFFGKGKIAAIEEGTSSGGRILMDRKEKGEDHGSK